jgi:hypothetical protein
MLEHMNHKVSQGSYKHRIPQKMPQMQKVILTLYRAQENYITLLFFLPFYN